jgi:hypothetical protein
MLSHSAHVRHGDPVSGSICLTRWSTCKHSCQSATFRSNRIIAEAPDISEEALCSHMIETSRFQMIASTVAHTHSQQLAMSSLFICIDDGPTAGAQ